MNRTARAFSALALAFLLAFSAALPAPAAARKGQDFDWVFTGFRGVTSRSFEQRSAATIYIPSAGKPCRMPWVGDLHYTLQLQRRSRWSWRDYADHRHLDCEHTMAIWPAAPSGAYRFKLELEPPYYNAVYTQIRGATFYDGAVPN